MNTEIILDFYAKERKGKKQNNFTCKRFISVKLRYVLIFPLSDTIFSERFIRLGFMMNAVCALPLTGYRLNLRLIELFGFVNLTVVCMFKTFSLIIVHKLIKFIIWYIAHWFMAVTRLRSWTQKDRERERQREKSMISYDIF